MGHDDVASSYPISTGFRRLTSCQRDSRDRGVTKILLISLYKYLCYVILLRIIHSNKNFSFLLL